MGQRGPVSKKTPQLQPTSKLTEVTPPDYLDEVASGEWCRLVTELKGLSNLDTTLLALHCQAYSDYRRYSRELLEKGESYTTPSGQVKFYPHYNAKREAYTQLLKTAVELGFTPNARARMNVPTAGSKTDKLSLAQEIANAKKGVSQ